MGVNAELRFVDAELPDLEGDGVSIIRIELWQAISELFTLAVELRTPAPHIDLDSVVGHIAELALFKDKAHAAPHAYLPRVRGLVRRARQISQEQAGMSTYRLLIVPPLWLTSLRVPCVTFHQQSAAEIAADIVRRYHEHGLTMVNVPLPPPQATPTHEYRCQYRESDLDCMTRLLAEDGIAFFFAGEALDWLRLTHDTAEYTSEVHAELPLLATGVALHGGADAVLRTGRARSLRAGKEHLRDYFFDNPFFHPTGTHRDDGAVDIVSLLGGRGYQEGALHDYRDGASSLMSEQERDGRARLGLQEQRSDQQLLTAELTCPLPAGAQLTIRGAHGASAERQLVVRSMSLWEFGEDAQAPRSSQTHRVTCIPADYPYRPPRVRKPRIHGLQRATVGGSEEIDVDEHGRVVVLFQWDDRLDDWLGPPDAAEFQMRRVPVAQDWAGPNRGLLTLPRLGDEVVIAYIDGDPDEPIIVGRLYNGRNQAAVKLPDDRTQSVWRSCSSPNGDGFHEIRFEDKVGSEELHIEAERLSSRLVKGEEQIDVGGKRTIHVGDSQVMKIDGDLDIDVKGSIREKAVGHSIRATFTDVHCSQREESSAMHRIETGILEVSASQIILSAGASCIVLTPGGILIKGPIVDINP